MLHNKLVDITASLENLSVSQVHDAGAVLHMQRSQTVAGAVSMPE